MTATTRMIAVRFRLDVGAGAVAGLAGGVAVPSGGDSWAAGLGTRFSLDKLAPHSSAAGRRAERQSSKLARNLVISR
jgi:hypothetical protein